VTITREQIVAALDSIGLAASPTTPDVISDGSAWPAWVSTTWVNAAGQRELRWYVFVALTAGDRNATVAEGDPLVEQLIAALWGIGLKPELIEPMQWAVEPGAAALPVLRVTARE
jgi:hypothetical protein